MRTVWKFPINVTDTFSFPLPAGHRVVHVGLQGGRPHMWVEVDTDQPDVERSFYVVGTGNPIPEDSGDFKVKYRGTFQLLGGGLVFHLYEEVFHASR